MSVVNEKGSEIPSLDSSNLSYEFEKIRIKQQKMGDTEDILERVDKIKKIPDNLEYLDDFYDKITGTSRTYYESNL